MKTPVLFALALSAAPFPVVAAVAPGATLAEVTETLGAPSGQVRRGERHLLYYTHGSVELVAGRVSRVELRSAEEQALIESREARRQADLAARRTRLIEEGTALRDRKLADAAFQAAPASFQVSFWEDFVRQYPGVSCVEPLSIARARLGEQVEEKRRRQEEADRLARIEERLAAAEREPAIRTRVIYRGRRDRQGEFALWPVSYTYYDAPLPMYTSPTNPPVTPFRGDLAQPERRDYGPRDHRCGSGWHSPGRESRPGRGRR